MMNKRALPVELLKGKIMTIKKYIMGYGIAILVIINIWLNIRSFEAIFINNLLPCFYYYNNVDNSYSEEIGSPRRDVEFDGVIRAYKVYNNGSVTEIYYEDNTKKEYGSYMMYSSCVEEMKTLLKKLKPMLENDQKEYKKNKDMQYKVRLIRIYSKEYRIVSEESDKIIDEIIKCIHAT